jgi:hypothetical protein
MVVSPVPGGDLLWSELAARNEALAAWCSERWLAAYPRLQAVPGELVATRLELHRLAESEVSPARQEVNGKIGLRYTRGGFGTPFFGEDQQLRVEGTDLVQQHGDQEVSRRALEIDLQAARFLGDWYGFAASVLETLRARSVPDAEASRVQLWPEHFDMSIELGAEAAGARAGYGLSPGDEQHPEPYAYVAPWRPPPAGELWNAEGFPGAELSYAELLSASDQRQAVLDFFGMRLASLTA